MSLEEALKNKEKEMESLIEGRIKELDEEILELEDEMKPLKSERQSLQKRLNTIRGVKPTPRYNTNNNPAPVKTGVLEVLNNSDKEMHRKEIMNALEGLGYTITPNHLGTTLSNLKKELVITNPKVGYYHISVEEEGGDGVQFEKF